MYAAPSSLRKEMSLLKFYVDIEEERNLAGYIIVIILCN